MRTFTINGKLYRAKPFTFNTLADLEDMGINLEQMQKKPMSAIRAYFALCAGGDAEYAGGEIQAHMIAGGTLDAISEAMAGELNDSDFFRSLSTPKKESETESGERAKRTRK